MMATTQKPYTLLWRYLRPHWFRVSLLAVLLLGGISLQLAAPQVIRRFLDLAQSGAVIQVLIGTAVLYFAVTIGQKAIALLTVYASEDLGWAATNQLRADLAEHCLRLDMGFHKLHPPGELIERIDGDVSNLAEYFSELVVQMLGNSLLALGILALLAGEDWRAGLISLVYTVLVLVSMRAIHSPVVAVWRDINQGFADLFGFLEERLAGTEDVRANGAEAYVMGRLFGLLNRIRRLRVRAEVLSSLTFVTSFMPYVGSLVAMLALTATLYLRGQMTIGAVFLLVAYVDLLAGPISTIRRQIANLQRALASVGRIRQLLQVQPQVVERPTVAVLPQAAPTVQSNQVSFAYKDKLSAIGYQPSPNGEGLPITNSPITNNHASVLHDVTFTLPAGRVLGLLGRTGSGKTTLTRLLFRLYDVDAGAITLDGVDVRDVTLDHLRRHVGMVTQDVQLFAATVRDNLTLFKNYSPEAEQVGDERIREVIELLGLESWFRSLPDGLDTWLGAGGRGLSAGEAQLLAFTRVFLRDPRLVVLDEASSRLDSATEQLLERAIDRLLDNRSGIVIAHRLGTVQRADDILILEGGRVVEFGERVVLANDPTSRFYHLLQTGMEEVLV
ncbi:MAG: ABC transporter ATP-binding protein/permease [Chloroflexi bacterium]|nr:ABC transporter ATP-binding protein/permease [Chloroflexota bacterium]MCI0580822.1 ABC transporter ATP-binding protein/permease [Chloroflexota bacterium]MCI0648184.1 ABC transporter ATP-binding protein/permease [Chloroflexota bacterium]MCI0730326.1 ABC transporter ATP-binding protein/permease [Chloroflexota bacterium]